MLTAKLPGGWKQRLAFGACVMHEPEILFLDEPTSGVDPMARRQLWTMISDFARHGSAILVTTHFLEEAEHCHKLGFMVSGKLVAQGSPTEIKSSQPGQIIEIITDDNQRASNLLKKTMEPWRVSIFADRLHVVLDEPETKMPDILNTLAQNGISVRSHKPIQFSLEDSFIGIVQRAGGAAEG
jgi:ABC-2 type transport system ATP-binding protein